MRGFMISLPLLVFAPSDGGQPPTPTEQFQSLLDEWKEHRDDYFKALGEAKSDQEQAKIFKQDNEWARALGNRALELVRNHSEEPVAVDALVWVVQNGMPVERGEALEILRRDYIESERIGPALPAVMAFHLSREYASAEALLREALSKSPHREIRGQACYTLAQLLKYRSDALLYLETHPKEQFEFLEKIHGAEGLKRFRARDWRDLAEEAERLFARVVEDYADVKNPSGVPLGDKAEGALDELRYQAVGQTAPEIEGEDIDGKRFKLSDYRGKVVVLTFSGNWCAPCRGMYPQERELVSRLKDEPFALLSVNTDEKKETLRKSIDKGEITWRCWWDGGVGGPITLKWGVIAFPTIYVLDHEGVIRYKDYIEGNELNEAVETLLKNMKAATAPQQKVPNMAKP